MSNDTVRQIMGEHSAYLARYSSASINKALALLRRIELQVATELTDLLDGLTPAQKQLLNQGKFTGPNGAKIARLTKIKEQIILLASEYRRITNEVIRNDGKALIASEIAFSEQLAGALAYTGEVGITSSQVMAAALKNPFEGRTLREYTRGIEQGVRIEMLKAIRDGFALSETTQQTVKRIMGNKVIYRDGSLVKDSNGAIARRSDGVTVLNKQSVTKLVRTSFTHLSAAAYTDTFKELGVERVVFTATIDGRTSWYCADKDGNVYDIDDAKKPKIPAHYNCRSTWAPDADGIDAGFRPFVKSDKSVSELGRDVKAGRISAAERDALIGRTSAANNFEDVLRNDKVFARQYLGNTRYRLWEAGLDFEKFSDPLARNYSIAELEAANRSLFKRLGLSSAKKAA